jgi:hypothetical protein
MGIHAVQSVETGYSSLSKIDEYQVISLIKSILNLGALEKEARNEYVPMSMQQRLPST